MRVCIIGLGSVGLPTAKYMSAKGIDVWGYDISEDAVTKAEEFDVMGTTRWDEVPSADAYIVCVNTFFNYGKPDLFPIFDVAEKMGGRLSSSPLISIESTLIPGTCRKIYREVFRSRVSLIHVPHRYWSEDPVRHGVRQLRVLGALNEVSLERGLKLYRDMLDIPLHIVPSVEVAEMCKVMENAYRYVQIAVAEEMRMICEGFGLDFEAVRRACNTKWNIEVLEARDGIGGHCLPKDVRYIISMGEDRSIITSSAVRVDQLYRTWLASKKSSRVK